MNPATPVLMSVGGAGGGVLVFFVTLCISAALISFVFFGLRAHHRKKHPTEEDIKETNRQRREREKLRRETSRKVNSYMKGEKPSEKESVPNGKRCGKYKKKNKK